MAFDRLLGEAYILMRADGRLIPKDVKKAGHAAGAEYSKSFDAELSKFEQDSLNRFRRKLAQSTAEIDFSDFRKQFGSVDDTVTALRKKMQGLRRDNGLTASSYNAIKRSINEWAVATKEMEREQANLNRTVVSFSATYRRGIEGMWRRYAEDLAKASRTGDFSKFRVQNEKTSVTLQRLNKELKDNAVYLGLAGDEIDDLVIKIDNWAKHQHSVDMTASGRSVRRETSKITKAFDSVDDAAIRFNTSFGKAFGKGSRNDFLNFAGSFVSGLTSIVTTLPLTLARNVSHLGEAFSEGFSAAKAANLTNFAAAGRGLTSVFASSGGPVGLILGLVAAMAAFGIALPAIISLVSGLVGAVTALAGSIVIGLIGALLALGPVVFAAVAGFGALAAAIITLAKDDSLKKAIKKNITDPWKDFTKELVPNVKGFLTFVSGGFKEMLDDLKPGIDDFFTTFKRRLGDPATRRDLGVLSDSMGKIFGNLSGASTAFLDGLISFFTQVTPFAERLSGYIEDLANRFARWAESADGKNAVSEFMDKAWASGKKVWEIIVTIGQIIGEVFGGGEETGDGFLQGILTKLQEVKTFLDTETGKKALSDWFENAKGIGEDIGKISIEVGKIIDYLDSEDGRKNAQLLMDAFVVIAAQASGAASMADAIGKIVMWLSTPIFVHALELMDSLWGKKDTTGTKPFEPPAVSDAAPGARGPAARNNSQAAQDARKELSNMLPQKEVLRKYLVSVDVDDLLYKEKRTAIENYLFRDKQIPIKGNEALWNATKGTVAGYVFEDKEVKIVPVDKDLRNWVAKWNKTNLDKTAHIRYAIDGKLPNGGTSTGGGVTVGNSARGRVVTGPHFGWTGEAGPEAIVPLDRPLNMVDPSVRALSAIAQGMKAPPMAAGGIAGVSGGASVVVAEGAVQVVSAATDPGVVAKVVLNGLGDALAGI